MFEADITKVVEEMAISIRETQEDFILDTIFPYCQETLQRKINKAELKQIILRGSRPKGKWIYTLKRRLIDETDEGCVYITDYRCSCSECGGDFGFQKMSDTYCKYCGAKMEGGEDEN